MIVLKLGGDIYKKGIGNSLLNDIRNLFLQEKMVIVHGGGDEVTEIAEKLGKKQTFITSPSGIRSRYTDKETVEIYTMVMAGRINKAITQQLLSHDLPAVGLAGIDGQILKAKRKKRLLIIDERGRKRIIPGGFTGKITNVNIHLLNLLLENGYLPVIAPIALSEEKELLNVDSDRAAANIAGALKAHSLVFLTDVQGVLVNGEYVKRIRMHEAEELLREMGPGMEKKILASIEALRFGVKEAIISSGFVEMPVMNALNHTLGTVITVE